MRIAVWFSGETNPFYFEGQSLPFLIKQVRTSKLEGTDCRTGLPLEEQKPKPYVACEDKKKSMRYMRRRKVV